MEQEKRKRRASGSSKSRNNGLYRNIMILSLALTGILAACLIMILTNRARTVITSDTVTFGLRNMGELATQAGYYTNINVIENPNRTIAGVPIPFTESRAICTYNGKIKAGLDFSAVQVQTDDVRRVMTFIMPEVRVLTNEIDLDSLRVYDESNSVFNKISMENYNQSLVEMKDKAQKTAVSEGILTAARSNAELLVRSFVLSLPAVSDYQLVFSWQTEEPVNNNTEQAPEGVR